MNCVNCGGRITSDGCTCTSADLLKKLERSNDDWIAEKAENVSVKKAFDGAIETIHEEAAKRILADEENTALKARLSSIHDVWGRWKDFARTSYPTVEQTHQALYDLGKAIEKSMTGYNPAQLKEGKS